MDEKIIVDEKVIDFKFHLMIVTIILIIQFFIVDIYAFFYLRHVINKNSELNSSTKALYMKEEYVPVIGSEAPSDYKFVIVEHNGNRTVEVYYTSNGEEITVELQNGYWDGTSYGGDHINVFLFLPICGFLLGMWAILRKCFRVGTFLWAQLDMHPFDRQEKIYLIYGISLPLSSIVYGMLGIGP